MMRDLHNNFKASRGISPAAASLDNTPFVSQILDTANFGSAEFVGICGSIADVDVTFTVLMEESDDSGMAGAVAVDDAHLIGTEAGAAPLFSDDDKTFKLGYCGAKRYIRVTITPAANTGNIFMAGIWLQGHPRVLPQSAQKV